jgi:acyl carrier protein
MTESSDTVAVRLASVFRDVFGRDVAIDPALTAKDVAGWDSLNHIRLMVTVQKAFRVRFTAAEVGSLKSVGELVTLIRAKLSPG